MAADEWPPPEEFADRLARLRRALGVENQLIAEATGVGTETVSKWAGGQEPKGLALIKLARFFGVSVEYLLEGRYLPGEFTRPKPIQTTPADPQTGLKPITRQDVEKKKRGRA